MAVELTLRILRVVEESGAKKQEVISALSAAVARARHALLRLDRFGERF
jgi:hypothetical protein